MPSPIKGTIQPVAYSGRLCDWCDEELAIWEGIIHRETRVDPAEWFAVCYECGGNGDV